MSAAAAQAPARTTAVRRRVPRYPVAVPVDVTVLRSGIPDTVPGRALDVGEGGVAVVLAGELRPGDSVGVEFRLPNLGLPLQAKAVVRHQASLRCGLEFRGLSPEQQAMIRYWGERAAQNRPSIRSSVVISHSSETRTSPTHAAQSSSLDAHAAQPERSALSPRVLWLGLSVFVVVACLGWWRWYRAWDELESRLPAREARVEQHRTGVPIKIPADTMQQFVTHKVDPEYPDAARQANIQGIVVLDALIGPDGVVEDLRPLSGPDVLAPAAVDAVKWWRFQPYRVNGEPVEVETTLAVEFRPSP